MVAAKLRAKGRKILTTKRSIHAPPFNIMAYNLSMMKALNYYSYHVEDKVKRTFAYTYWKQQNHDVKKLDSLSDCWFSTLGAVAHMVLSEIPIHEADTIRLDNAYHQLLGFANQASSEVVDGVKPVVIGPSIQDRIKDASKVHIAEFEGWLDEFVVNGKTYSAKEYLTKNQTKAPVIAHVINHFKPILAEYGEYLAGQCEQLTEAYSHMGKRKVKALFNYVTTILAECSVIARVSRTMKAPRKRKEQPPSKLVQNLLFLKEYPDLGLKSIHPEKIIGADQVWMFDTEHRRMIKYEAMDGMTLSVKGTTMQNWNPEKSGSKIIRKPEVQLKDVSENGKRAMGNMFNEINGVVRKISGRTSRTTVIVRVFA